MTTPLLAPAPTPPALVPPLTPDRGSAAAPAANDRLRPRTEAARLLARAAVLLGLAGSLVTVTLGLH